MFFRTPLFMSSRRVDRCLPQPVSTDADDGNRSAESAQERDCTTARRARRRRFTVVQPVEYENEGKRTGSIAVSVAIVYRNRWPR